MCAVMYVYVKISLPFLWGFFCVDLISISLTLLDIYILASQYKVAEHNTFDSTRTIHIYYWRAHAVKQPIPNGKIIQYETYTEKNKYTHTHTYTCAQHLHTYIHPMCSVCVFRFICHCISRMSND